MKNESVKHDIERRRRIWQLTRGTEVHAISRSGRSYASDTVGIRIDRDQPKLGRGKQMPTRMPSRTNRKHLTPATTQPPADEHALPSLHLAIVNLERRLMGDPVKKIVRVIRRNASVANHRAGGYPPLLLIDQPGSRVNLRSVLCWRP